MKTFQKIIALAILLTAVFYNYVSYFPETRILADPNDNIFQYSLVQRTHWVWKNYGCPFSLSCFPNLTDHVVTAWAEGYPLPFYYSHLPQIAIVSSYEMFVKPVSEALSFDFSIYSYYNQTKFLLLVLFPIPVFIALSVLGINPVIAATTAFIASHFSTDGLYGIDPPSYLWRGYGLTSQLYAIFSMPLALAYIFKSFYMTGERKKDLNLPLIKNHNIRKFLAFFYRKNILLSILFTTLTTAGHLGIGMMTMIMGGLLVFKDLHFRPLLTRILILSVISASVIFLLSYWIVPAVYYNNYHMISFWDPIWKFDSYGLIESVRQMLAGEIYDWKRTFPAISLLVIAGIFITGTNSQFYPFAIMFSFIFAFYFGRTTWGSLIDIIPGMKDFHLHRFIVALHIAGLFLIPFAIQSVFNLINTAVSNTASYISGFVLLVREMIRLSVKNKIKISALPPKFEKYRKSALLYSFWFKTGSSFLFLILIFYFFSFIIIQTTEYAKYNSIWIDQANKAFLSEKLNMSNLKEYLSSLPYARVYAGRPGNWGHSFRIGSTQLYMQLAIEGYDMSQFLPETWSPMSENEQNFDERYLKDFDLLNIKYMVAPSDNTFEKPKEAISNKSFGFMKLYELPTSGWFDIVTSLMDVKSAKTNFINIVHYWHRSYPRMWKMHPLIDIENRPSSPYAMEKTLKMTDEVSYVENNEVKNIFDDYPFVFPESTPSAVIKSEKAEKQVFTANISVPDNCKNCMLMFKQSYHPNWKAKIDGNTVSKYSIFPFYIAVPVPAGEHEIEFSYSPGLMKVFLIWLEVFIIIIFSAYSILVIKKNSKIS